MPLTPETTPDAKTDIEIFRPRFSRFLTAVIEPAVLGVPEALKVAAWQTPDPVPFESAITQDFTPVATGFRWGPVWSTCWFRLTGTAPNTETLAGRPLDLRFSTRTEATLWTNSGGEPTPLRGLDINRDTIDLTHHLNTRPGDPIELFIEAACNHPFGISTFDWDTNDTHDRWRSADPGHLQYAQLAPRNEAVRSLADTYRFASRLLDETDPASPDSTSLFEALTAATHAIDDRDVPATADAAHAILTAALRSSARASHLGLAVAHAHIDTAWLWPIRETQRKIIRSWTNTLEVLDRNPRATFIASQPQQYGYLERDAPAVLDRIKNRVAEGRWEPIGGMWVEPDVNVPSAESLIRQTLLGQRYFEHLFGETGADQTVLYLPDTFGFPASLPNIMIACGLDTFITNKIAWNQATPYPYTNFHWQGLGNGGRRPAVLAHFTPNHDYNNTNSPKELIKAKTNLRGHPAATSEPLVFLHPYGFGDGGGGPTLEHADAIDRTAPNDTTSTHPALPAIRHGSMKEFRDRLRRLDDSCEAGLPAHTGELYLELHRGTLTTHAWLKQANRDCERDLRIAEMLAFAGPAGLPHHAAKFADRLTEAWKLLCLQQFHDILPGSSIAPVYNDARRDFDAINAITTDIIETAHPAWARPSNPVTHAEHGPEGTILNPASSPASAVIKHAGRYRFVAKTPPISVTPLRDDAYQEPVEIESAGNETVFRNEHLVAHINRAGQITSLRSRTAGTPGRELAAEPLNRLALYRDIPMNWDAWDIDAYTEAERLETNEKAPESWRIKTSDPLRAEIEIVRTMGDASTITQSIRLDAGAPRLDIITNYDWNETHRYLRVEAPTTIDTRTATYDIQAGSVQRPTTRDTQETRFAFEVCAHRWMDLSGDSGGLAMLNTGRFGCGAVNRNGRTTMHISLLRAPSHPDPTAGREAGSITYSLMPHAGDWRGADVDREADRLNNPIRALAPACTQPWTPVVVTESAGQRLEIAAIKPAYDDPESVVLRLIETRGVEGTASIKWNLPVLTVWRTDAIERPTDASVAHKHNTTTVQVRPHDIITLIAQRA